MTLDQIIARLEEYRNELGGNCEVRLMTQPNWPFEWEITGIVSQEEMDEDTEDDDEHRPDMDTPDNIVYIVEGQQIGYGQKKAFWMATK